MTDVQIGETTLNLSFCKMTSPEELEKAFSVLRELRTHLTFQDFIQIYEQSRAADSFTLVAAMDGHQPVGIMGYRILVDFVRGRQMYIDDLVTTSTHRSQGIGAALLKFAEEEAERLECQNLRLCARLTNTRGQKFYEREGWSQISVSYLKSL